MQFLHFVPASCKPLWLLERKGGVSLREEGDTRTGWAFLGCLFERQNNSLHTLFAL